PGGEPGQAGCADDRTFIKEPTRGSGDQAVEDVEEVVDRQDRYKSLCLHDPVWYDHLPYIPFPDHWPIFSPKDKIADWLEMYTRVMELDYWTSTECLRASHEDGEWKVEVLRNGEPITLKPKHLVLATGMSGFPSAPLIRGEASFRRAGGLIFHSSEFTSGAAYKGKNCIVVGSSTSAH